MRLSDKNSYELNCIQIIQRLSYFRGIRACQHNVRFGCKKKTSWWVCWGCAKAVSVWEWLRFARTTVLSLLNKWDKNSLWAPPSPYRSTSFYPLGNLAPLGAVRNRYRANWTDAFWNIIINRLPTVWRPDGIYDARWSRNSLRSGRQNELTRLTCCSACANVRLICVYFISW